MVRAQPRFMGPLARKKAQAEIHTRRFQPVAQGQQSASTRAQAAAELDEYADALSDEELDAGERAQLQEENALLFGQMNTMANEAEQRMADIAAMSSQLSHYLHEQDEAIGEIRKDLDVTNDNLQTGNAYLDSAARHSRDFRIFILTFLLVASFSLLFLDWYYD